MTHLVGNVELDLRDAEGAVAEDAADDEAGVGDRDGGGELAAAGGREVGDLQADLDEHVRRRRLG